MRVSSAAESLDSHQPIFLIGHESGASQAYVWPRIKHYFYRLDRLMTAIAHAEAGNLDAVQKILDENKATKQPGGSSIGGNGRIVWR